MSTLGDYVREYDICHSPGASRGETGAIAAIGLCDVCPCDVGIIPFLPVRLVMRLLVKRTYLSLLLYFGSATAPLSLLGTSRPWFLSPTFDAGSTLQARTQRQARSEPSHANPSSGHGRHTSRAPCDLIWGIGYRADALPARQPPLWRGLSILGKALQNVQRLFRDRAPHRRATNQVFLGASRTLVGTASSK